MASEVVSFFARGLVPTATFQAKEIRYRFAKGGKKVPMIGDSSQVKAMKAALEDILKPFAPLAPVKGPVVLALEIDFPFPPEYFRFDASVEELAADRRYKTTKPDCSNLAKGIEDQLVRLGFIEDDDRVVKLIVSKHISHHPGIHVSITPEEVPS